MRNKMNKEIFLRDLRNFLSDLPIEEREQAIKYYEDYFEDAGPENEQQVIQELGTPIDIAKQIKSVNQENIEYGKGNTFHSSGAYPDIYIQNAQQNAQNSTHNIYAYQNEVNQKKSWTQEPGKVALVIILALLAIPVGLPLICTLFGIFISIVAVIFSLVFAFFVTAATLVFSGIISLISAFALLSSAGVANTLLLVGIGLILVSVGILLFWFCIFFCKKFFPAFFSLIGKLCSSIGKGLASFFR